MTITEIIAIVLTASSLVTAFSVLWTRLVHPIQREIRQINENTKQIQAVEDKIQSLRINNQTENEADSAIHSLLIETLIAVLDGLEQVGANHTVTEQKKKLIIFLTKNLNA